jgi:hypothetical protein
MGSIQAYSYEHLYPLLDACKNQLMLSDQQLTFFVAHAVIDEKYAEDVKMPSIAGLSPTKRKKLLFR